MCADCHSSRYRNTFWTGKSSEIGHLLYFRDLSIVSDELVYFLNTIAFMPTITDLRQWVKHATLTIATC